MIPDMDHDFGGLLVHAGPGLSKPLAPHESRTVEEIVTWLGTNHA
jgi:hypothetical protein